MKFTFRWPSVGLEVGTLLSDEFSDTILTKIGVREMARRCSLSPTTVSLFAAGKVKLPWPRVMGMAIECGLEESLWTATIYDRMTAAEKLGWIFHPQDSVKRKEQELMNDREAHGMNCAHRSDSDEPCTCACRHRRGPGAAGDDREGDGDMNHMNKVAQGLIDMAKRIESLDTANADLRARLEDVTKDRDNELADNTGLALKCAALAEECDNFKALASRETSRRLDAEKARDEQAEAVRVLADEVRLWNYYHSDHDEICAAKVAREDNPLARAAVEGESK